MEPIDPSVMRRINSASTMCALFDHGALSMHGLQKRTGLSRRTLDLILEPLVASGWVHAGFPEPANGRTAGRPARRYDFNAAAGVVMAVQLDIEAIELLVTDLGGRRLHHQHVSVDASTSRAERLGSLLSAAKVVLNAIGRDLSSVRALTVSTPGIVRDDGSVDLPLSIPEWSGFSIAAELEKHFSCPVTVENDAKLAALGELHARDGREQDFLYMRIDGYRVGVGIVVGGQLYRGHDGAAGEIVWARALGFSAAQRHPLADLASTIETEREAAETLATSARGGDVAARAAIDDLAAALAPGITTLAWVLAPEIIVIGGAINHVSDLLIPALQQQLAEGDRPVEARIVASELGDDAMVDGALRRSLTSFRDLLSLGEDLPEVIHADAKAGVVEISAVR